MNEKERLQSAIDYLKQKDPDLTNQIMSVVLEYRSPNYVSDVLSVGNKSVSDKFLERLENKYGISREWVKTGKGKVVVGKPTNRIEIEPDSTHTPLKIKTPAQGVELGELMRMINNLAEENRMLREKVNSLEKTDSILIGLHDSLREFVLKTAHEFRGGDYIVQQIALGKLESLALAKNAGTGMIQPESVDKKSSPKKTEKAR